MSFSRKLKRFSGVGLGSTLREEANPESAGQSKTEQTEPVEKSPEIMTSGFERSSDSSARLERMRLALRNVIAKDVPASPTSRTSSTSPTSRSSKASLPNVDAQAEAQEAELPGTTMSTDFGPLRVVERLLDSRHCHGDAPVRGGRSVVPSVVAKLSLDQAMVDVDFQHALYFDTETTGLAGGAGTVPFLIGMAWFEDDALRISQLFLPRLGEEAPMLHRLRERIEQASCLVSYNGKSFDWPLLRTRFVMNRVPMPSIPPHLDLLHCARRIYKRRFSRVRLIDLEAEVLGFRREGDVPGSEIPELYFDFVRRGIVDRLGGVIEHNQLDLIALAAGLAKMVAHFEQVQPEDDPRDHLSLAEVAVRGGDEKRASDFALAAAAGGGDAECTVKAHLLSARLERRRGSHALERFHLESALQASDVSLHSQVSLALAKLFEHRIKDFEVALNHAAHTEREEGKESHERRMRRLRSKLTRRPPRTE